MNADRFDRITRLFAQQRLTRRQAVMMSVAAGVAASTATAAQNATPIATTTGEKTSETLFLQAFQSGSIAPKADATDRYVLTLKQGLGQTIYFTDRPERVVGVTPTAQFLGNLGFPTTNPPNAALVVEKEGGTTEIAVVELFDPSYDEATHTATYDVAVLEEWERELGVGFTEVPGDLTAFGPEFGAAHLFIDDCADGTVICNASSMEGANTFTVDAGFCYVDGCCRPCTDGTDVKTYWAKKCQEAKPGACQCGEPTCPDDSNHCTVAGWDTWLIPCVP